MKRRDFFKWLSFSTGFFFITKGVKGLEYYPNPSDKKWAILYSTWCGTARDAAVWISEGMGGIANVFDIREEVNLNPYDHIIVGGAIRYGRTSDRLEKYLRENSDWLSKKLCGLFVVCGNMQRPVTPEVHRKLLITILQLSVRLAVFHRGYFLEE
ncbi:MAG: hypothetical protein H0Z29_02585 [Candidatus Marinimicrobia bacterium]|nr:hypothetical protein [Candidatus Neomarinimicrobiota bacterium]